MSPRSSAPRTLPRRSAERNFTSGKRGERGGGLHDRVGRLRERLAPEHDDEVAVAAVERAHRLLDGPVARGGAVAGERPGELLGDRRRPRRARGATLR